MIYEGKEYKEVTDGSCSTGDLLSMTKTSHRRDGYFSHIEQSFYFAVDNERYPLAERTMQDGSKIRGHLPSPFKRYRYVKDVEELLSEHNVTDGDFFVIIDDTCAHGLLNGTIVRKSKMKASYAGMPITVLRSSINKFVNYKDVRKATEEDVDIARKTYNLITQTDTVNSPSHYNQTNIEAIDIIEDVTAGYQSNVKYHIGNTIKYLIRAPFKNNTVEDLKKAAWYVNRAIEKLEGEK